MAEGPAAAPPRRPAAAYGADLALVAVCGWFLWHDWSQAQAGQVGMQPRTWTFMLNLTCTFVLAHRGLALVQRGVAGGDVVRGLGVLKWLLAIVLPLVVAVHIEREVQRAHREQVDALAAAIAARAHDALRAHGRVDARDLSAIDSPYLRALTVRTDTGAFLLEVRLPAFGAGGYTGRWSSTERRWHIHHADPGPETEPEFDAAGPTLDCRPGEEGLQCT